MTDKFQEYQKTQKAGLEAKVVSASPHELVRLLFEKLCEKLEMAHQSVVELKSAQQDKPLYIKRISESFLRASHIITALKSSLIKEPNEKLYNALNFLYAHTQYYIAEANQTYDESAIKQAIKVSRELLSIWESIPAEFHALTSVKG